MKKSAIQLTFILVVMLINTMFGQAKMDTVLLQNGEVIPCKVMRITENDLVLKQSEKMVREFNIDRDRVFSYTTS
ncbi:MAG TPA: hypothetical protein VLB84_07785, partial [Bacteroidia bacterium]|nr:hypothetical protein [Bacteroidia bacterium]